MIKITDLNVVLTDNTGSEVQGTGEMIVGTSPITKEVRDEELNLQNTPNFVISALIPNADVDVTENYNVSFDANEKHYSTVMTVMTKTNLRTGVKMNLQSTGAEITEEEIVHEPVYSVHAFDKDDQEIPLNNIPAYQSGRNVVFDGAYLKCREDNSGEWVINPNLVYGRVGDFVITDSQDAQGRSFLNEGLDGLNWWAFEDNNERTLTNFKVIIPEGDYNVIISEGEVLTTFDITFVGHAETHTLEFDNAIYDTSYDIYTGEKSQARFNVLYDGTSIHLDSSMFSGLVYNKFEPIEYAGGIFKAKDALHEVSAGQTYTDDVTVTYEGLTASCTVTLTVTDSGAEPDYTTKIKCNTSKGEFLVYSTDPNDTIQTVQYENYREVDMYYIECSWSVETDNPEYQNLTDFMSYEEDSFDSGEIRSGSLNGTLTGDFGGFNGNDFVQIVESLSIQIEYVGPEIHTKIKCTTSKGEFLVYSTDPNDTIQTVQYNDYTDIGGEYRIPCSWSVETNNPDYQNLTDFQSYGGHPFNSDHILSESLNGTVTGQFGGLIGDYVEIVESLSIQIEYVEPE